MIVIDCHFHHSLTFNDIHALACTITRHSSRGLRGTGEPFFVEISRPPCPVSPVAPEEAPLAKPNAASTTVTKIKIKELAPRIASSSMVANGRVECGESVACVVDAPTDQTFIQSSSGLNILTNCLECGGTIKPLFDDKARNRFCLLPYSCLRDGQKGYCDCSGRKDHGKISKRRRMVFRLAVNGRPNTPGWEPAHGPSAAYRHLKSSIVSFTGAEQGQVLASSDSNRRSKAASIQRASKCIAPLNITHSRNQDVEESERLEQAEPPGPRPGAVLREVPAAARPPTSALFQLTPRAPAFPRFHAPPRVHQAEEGAVLPGLFYRELNTQSGIPEDPEAVVAESPFWDFTFDDDEYSVEEGSAIALEAVAGRRSYSHEVESPSPPDGASGAPYTFRDGGPALFTGGWADAPSREQAPPLVRDASTPPNPTPAPYAPWMHPAPRPYVGMCTPRTAVWTDRVALKVSVANLPAGGRMTCLRLSTTLRGRLRVASLEPMPRFNGANPTLFTVVDASEQLFFDTIPRGPDTDVKVKMNLEIADGAGGVIDVEDTQGITFTNNVMGLDSAVDQALASTDSTRLRLAGTSFPAHIASLVRINF